MKFRSTTIAPAGRNKYGNYTSKGNITRSVVSTTYGGNASTTSIAEPEVVVAPTETAQFNVNIDKGNIIFTSQDLAGYVAKTVGFAATRGNTPIPVFIVSSGITGSAVGMTLSTDYNGTSGATLVVSAGPSLTTDEGTLNIPIVIYQGNGSQPQGIDESSWNAAMDESQVYYFKLSWTVDRAGETASVYRLSLSNDNASIICDSGGTPLTASTITFPTSSGKTYYGSERLTGATYDVDWDGVVGGISAITNGVLTISFNPSTFNFMGSNAAIVISAKTGNPTTVVDVKTFNLAKAIAGATGPQGNPGQNGYDATIYWLQPSYDEVIYDPNTQTPSPSVINATGYTQTGINPVQPVGQGYSIGYKLELLNSPGAWSNEQYLPQTGLTITSAICETYQRIRLLLNDDNEQQVVDQEDIDILRNGTSGQTGRQGRTGAAIRGPYDYGDVSATTRYWYCGVESTLYPESVKWIDVLYKDGVYWYCNDTFYGNLAQWDTVKDNFTSGETFDFVAANLILANNAKIKFLTGNGIYLMSGGTNTITAGMQGGSGYTFWAGAETPANAPFSVNYKGEMVARSGKFYGNVYVPFVEVTDLHSSGTYYYAEENAHLINTTYYSTTNPGKLAFPAPSSGWSGFEYKILIPQFLTAAASFSIKAMSANAQIMYDFVSNSLSNGRYIQMDKGYFTFTCLKYGSDGWVWALVDASPNALYSMSNS